MSQLPPNQQEILELLALLRPWKMQNLSKVRIGNEANGGYVLPETVLECDAVVSIGVGNDVSFDLVLADRGAKILRFDHTVPDTPVPHPNLIFDKKGWGVKTEGDFIGFKDIHARLQALKPRRTMLKFDIEGGEYDVIDALGPEDLASFDVIACEFHEFHKLNDRDFYEKLRRVFEKLNLNHAPVHLHANNAMSVVLVQGISIPLLLELTYLRRTLDSLPSPATDAIPGPYDRPNIPGIPDIYLNPF